MTTASPGSGGARLQARLGPPAGLPAWAGTEATPGAAPRWALTRWRIGTRLRGAFAALLLLVLGAALLAGWRLSALAARYDALLDRQAQLAELLAEARDNTDDAARKLPSLVGLPADARALALAELGVAERHAEAALRLLEATWPAEARRPALEPLRQHQAARQAVHERVLALLEAGQTVAARRLIEGEGEAALSLVTEDFRHLAEQQQAATQDATRRLQERQAADHRLLMLLCCGALLLGGALAATVTRSIVRPLREAERVARELAAGRYQQRILRIGSDEVGAVARVMNTLAAAVAEREQQLLRLAHTDRLTGLAQRVRFIAEAAGLLETLAQQGRAAAVLCIDVDRLKTVNSLLGFDAGDAVLVGTAQRLRGMAGADDPLARIGGGSFVVLLPLQGAADGEAAAAAVQQAVEHRLHWHGHALDVSVSQGIALFPQHGRDAELLLSRAEQAMFEAKRLRQRTLHYGNSLEVARQLHLSLLSDLQEAIVCGQLRQFLQPKVSPHDGRLHGAEALVRWQHPERGWLPPAEFVPFAERSGRIRRITQWMIERAVATLARWRAEGRDGVIAVNVSTLDLQDRAWPARVAAALAEAGVPPAALQLELTETGLMASGDEPVQVLHALREIGVRLAIDDFGTGQSSLAYLQQLPVHELKIDRSFVTGVDVDPRRQALLRSIVDIGHSLGLVVTAEGVETPAELAVLRDAGCDLVQGYLVARPLDGPAFEAWRDGLGRARAVALPVVA